MAGKTRLLFLCVLLVTIVGCTGRSLFTVEVFRTPTPFQPGLHSMTATPLPPPTYTFTPDVPEPTSTFTPVLTLPPVSTVMPSDYSPILYGKKYDANTFFLVLGGVQGDVWIPPDLAVASFGGEWDYDIYTFEESSFQVHGFAPQFSPPSRGYFVGTNATVDGFGMVGVARGWPVRQGNVQELSSDSGIYQQVVLDWLRMEGISSPQLGDLRIYRVDLENDGVDEIFISATHLDDSQHYTKAGDYSVILMRRVMGNDAVTLRLVGDVYRTQEAEITYPRTYLLGNFLDLNRDGVLETIVDIEYWEGFDANIYRIDGQNVIKVP